MSAFKLTVQKNLLALEDFLLGFGQVTQDRGGVPTIVTEVNAGNFPFDQDNSLQEIVDFLEVFGEDVQAIADNLDQLLAANALLIAATAQLVAAQQLLDDSQALLDELEALDVAIIDQFRLDTLVGVAGESYFIDDTNTPAWSELKFVPQSLSVDTEIPDDKDGVFYGDLVLETDVDITFGINSNLRLVE